MRNYLLLIFFFYQTNLVAQRDLTVQEKILDFRNSHYNGEVENGVNVTDSLLRLLDYSELFSLQSNQPAKGCPAFGVMGSECYKVLVETGAVNVDDDSLVGKFIFSLKVDSNSLNIVDTLSVKVIEILQYKTSDWNAPIIEITGEYSSENAGVFGVFKIISSMNINGRLLDKSEFPEEAGYLNAWLGSYSDSVLLAWGFERFPSKYFDDFDIGNGELKVNYKYLENGWSSNFSLHDFITENIEDIPVSDYKYYGVKTEQELFDKWFQIAPDLGYSTWGYRYDQLELNCK